MGYKSINRGVFLFCNLFRDKIHFKSGFAVIYYREVEIIEVALVLGVINTIISTIACPIIASHKNRSVGGWIFDGLVLGLLGLIIVACLKPKDF